MGGFAGPSHAESGVTTAWKTTPAGDDDDIHTGGVEWEDVKTGTGASPQIGDQIGIQYQIKAFIREREIIVEDTKGKARDFRFGVGQLLPGMDEGIRGMKTGGVRKMRIPGNLAFGDKGLPSAPGWTKLLAESETRHLELTVKQVQAPRVVSFQQHELPVQQAPVAKAPVHVLPGAPRPLLPNANTSCHPPPQALHAAQSVQMPHALEARRLVARVGETSAPCAACATSSKAAARTLRFADEVPRHELQTRESGETGENPLSLQIQGPAPKSVLRRPHQGSQSQAAGDARAPDTGHSAANARACTALACRSGGYSRRSDAQNLPKPNGMPASRRPLPEPELLVVKFLYLSRLPAGSWMQSPAQYQLSLHVGEDARSDPPDRPGPFSTSLVQAGPPLAVPPEEAQLKQRIASAVEAMERSAPSLSGSGRASSTECRFKARVTVRLSEAGPGPAAGGPVYFRIDAWSLCTSSLFGRPSQPELFARAFVPINDSKYHRRACTWPMIDAAGNDVAYVTCEFSFARIPSPVQDLHVDVMANDVKLAWLPPANEDKAVPLKGYRVDSRLLGRGKRASGGGSSWLHAGDVEAREGRENVFLANSLKPDSLYIFRVCAVNEVGLGEPDELEVQTGPCAPAGCGQPRLAGCSGPVLAVEWDPPMYDGGANLVAYRLWVRPFSVTDADPQEWLEIGHVKHIPDSVQRAEIHTEEFDQRIGRYLCRVAAINAAGEVGPATADAVSLTLPNPCAVSRPTPAPNMPLALSDGHGSFGPGMWSNAGSSLLTMTINEPGKRKVTVPLFKDGMSAMDLPLGYFGGHADGAGQSSLTSEQASAVGAGHDLALPERLDAFSSWPLPPDLESRHWYHEDAFGSDPGFQDPLSQRAVVPYKAVSGLDEGREVMNQELLQSVLEEKRLLLDASLQNFQHLTDQLSRSPESEALRQRQEESEIEAAGLQAEVAVLSQKLSELEAMTALPYNTGNDDLYGLLHRGPTSPNAGT
eukprot:s629_g4.t2